ncbi:hypothetical protein [Streptomyces abikoensis]|uniref:hypothetical protein n=1 Tax=Streptomyces abikoensis TaxID=97398 RepID=UPI001677D2C4|nr:hypothetical protein [Streptomyces abikoensis]GGP65102.1 hypothetical protein GCM10010214_44170 [Streptomyces abikoensis]
MPHTDNGRRTGNGRKRLTARRRLRHETPSTVAVLADETDFAAMRRYRSFGFDDHAGYLRQVDGLLRALASQGTHISLTLFDPTAYEEYCADTRLDPDTPTSRTRYTADIAATGARLTYDGRPLTRLLPDLVRAAEQQATWEYASALLEPGADAGRTAFARASRLLRRLLETAGDGRHHLVCSVSTLDDANTPLVAVVEAECAGGVPRLGESAALLFCTVLAAGLTLGSHGGVVLRTIRPGEPETVRGWCLDGDGLRPLTAGEVFAAYCTDATTGEPVPPEHGVEYLEGLPLA